MPRDVYANKTWRGLYLSPLPVVPSKPRKTVGTKQALQAQNAQSAMRLFLCIGSDFAVESV